MCEEALIRLETQVHHEPDEQAEWNTATGTLQGWIAVPGAVHVVTAGLVSAEFVAKQVAGAVLRQVDEKDGEVDPLPTANLQQILR